MGAELPAFSPQLTWSHYRALMRVEKPARLPKEINTPRQDKEQFPGRASG